MTKLRSLKNISSTEFFKIWGVTLWHSRLRVWHCHFSNSGHYYQFHPWPGNFHILQVQPKKKKSRHSHCGSVVTNPTIIHEDVVLSLASLSGSGIWHCHELWHRPAAAAPVQPLTWELPQMQP